MTASRLVGIMLQILFNVLLRISYQSAFIIFKFHSFRSYAQLKLFPTFPLFYKGYIRMAVANIM